MSLHLNKLPRLHLYVIQFVLLFLVIQSLLRATFFISFSSPTNPVPVNEIFWSFYLGLKYDLQFTLILSLPMLLLGWISPVHPVYSHLGKRIWMSYSVILVFSLFIFHAANFGYYAYLAQSIDATALRFLKNPVISLTMVWQTYPVISGSFILLILVTACYYILRTMNSRINADIRLNIKWKAKTGIVIVTFVVVFFGLLAKVSWYPLRWSDAFFSSNHTFTAYLASNPIMYFSNTLKNRAETYDIKAARKYYPLITRYLGVDEPDIDNLDYTRKISFDEIQKSEPPNIVIVILESFATYKTGLSGNPLNPTPNFDALAREGIYFNNFFVPHTGTARSIWTLMTGLPDIEKNKTSTRNPLIVKQHMIINAFEDYNKFYFLGGSASWANIRGLLASNVENLEIYEEGSYESPRIDVWGISDLNLLTEANSVLKNNTEPFFAIIQTSGNHRPYTIPEDNHNFELIAEEDPDHLTTDYGFQHLDELNSFRFMDHSIGEYMKLARKEDYYDNTLFVFYGDHGITNRTGKHTPISEDVLQVSSNRVPLVLYGPNILDGPAIINKVASQVDIMPTLASLTKTSYTNTTLGRDLFDPIFDNMRYAYTIVHHGFRTIGVMTDKFWAQMKFDGSEPHLYQLDTETPKKDVADEYPDINEKMVLHARALNATIRYMRENNHAQYQ